MSIGLLGQKIGMTSVYDANGKLRPVTVIAAGDNVVVSRINADNNGYSAVKVGYGTQKEHRLTGAALGEFKKAEVVDVIGRSKCKGFQGVMKKHNFAGQGAAHGSKTHRRNGAIGNRSTPGRIWQNMGMPGHMGDERVTVQNLEVLQVRETEKVILISGAVPGANGSLVVVRPAIKHPENIKKLHEEHRKRDEAEQAKKPAIKIR